GQINVKLSVNGNQGGAGHYEIISFSAGDRVNMVPGEAVVKIGGSRAEDIVERFQAFCKENNLTGKHESVDAGHVTLTLYGKTVHGMEPQNGINAGLECIHFLRQIDFSGVDRSFLDFADNCLYHDPFGEKLGIAHSEDVLGPLTVNAGVMEYHHDGGGSVFLNIRRPLGIDFDKTISTISERAQAYGWTVEESRETQPHYIPADNPMIKTLQEAYHAVTGDDTGLLTSGGATYASLMKNCVAFGAGFPGKAYTAHQIDEYAELDDLLKATAIYAKALYDLSNL
ncbi:MAG: Sapep family Mn(2+)-dependent dipeptidase, partial [Tuberibacillus sp.]